MAFSAHLPGLDAAVRAHACDPAVLRLADGSETPVDVIHERPSEVEVMGGLGAIQDKPTVEVAVAQVASLPKGAIFAPDPDATPPTLEGRLWRVTSATRPGDGRWWLAVVEDVGEAT